MPIKKVKKAFSISDDINPILKQAGYKVRWFDGEYLRGHWEVNKHNRMFIEPMRPGHIGLKLEGHDAMAIAKTIEKEFPRLDLQVTETERPTPSLLTRFIRSIRL
jgi:hypothetical protein